MRYFTIDRISDYAGNYIQLPKKIRVPRRYDSSVPNQGELIYALCRLIPGAIVHRVRKKISRG